MIEDVLLSFGEGCRICDYFEKKVSLDGEVLAERGEQRKRRGLGG